MKTRIHAAILTLAVAAGSIGLAAPVEAARRSRANGAEKGWRLGTYVGALGTVAALAMNKDTIALLAGGATLLSYTQWKKEMRKRHHREDRAYYNAYRNAWFARHRRGRR